MTNYRIDRRYLLPAVGFHLVAASLFVLLAFWLWAPLGLVVVVLLLNALRLVALPPVVVQTSPAWLRLKGPRAGKAVELPWTDVDQVTGGAARLVVEMSDGRSVTVLLTQLGARAGEAVRDVYDRLNDANGYERFDPSA